MRLGTARWLLVLSALPGVAAAHPGHDTAMSVIAGVSHPLSGADHWLVMLLVGVLAGIAGGRARWLLPLSFLAAMAFGGGLAAQGFRLPHVEATIGLSAVVIGLLVAARVPLSVGVTAAFVGAFAIVHGFAHGMEMSAGLSTLTYGVGFLVSTAGLHLGGLALAKLSAPSTAGRWALRATSCTAALVGCALIVASI
jgi:urease accessory protein